MIIFCIMKIVIILFCLLIGVTFIPIIISSILFNYYPTAWLTNWFRRHIITDVDLEGTPKEPDGNDSL